MAGLTGRALIASRCAKFFKDGDFVNLGIGLPLLCVNYLPEGVHLWLEAEIGIVGCGASPKWEDADPDLIDAGGQPASMIVGGSVCDHATSFAFIRGGHIDAAVLGTLQGLSLADIGQTSHGDNTAVSLIEADGDELRVVFRDDNSHLTGQEGLSTFGKQTWWKTKGMVEPGQLYRPASHEQCRLFGAPESGQSTAVWYNGQELIGLFQTVREPDALRITWYGMDPLWRGRRQGIPPMGQIIQQGRRLGLEHLRLTCTDESLRPFWQRLDFYGDGPELEKNIRLQIPNLREWVME